MRTNIPRTLTRDTRTGAILCRDSRVLFTGSTRHAAPVQCRYHEHLFLCSYTYVHPASNSKHRHVHRTLAALDGGRRQEKAYSSRRASGPAATDAAGLLQALIQLASNTTIIVGSHQAYALLEALEQQLPQQLPGIDICTVASGLWAMTRLQLQPSSQALQAITRYLLAPPQQGSSTSSRTYASSSSRDSLMSSRLACCDSRTIGSLCYSLNFYMLRDATLWAVAASACVTHLAVVKPTCISNLLQGVAASGWVMDPDTHQASLAPPPAAASKVTAGAHDSFGAVTPAIQQPANALVQMQACAYADIMPHTEGMILQQEQQDAVTALLKAVEQLLLSQPHLLQEWRMRDISQMCQAYVLTGYNCAVLFAAVANHLLGLSVSSGGYSTARTLPHSSSSTESVVQLAWQQQQVQHGHSRQSSHGKRQLRFHKGSGLQRLADCRAGDAAGLAWAYVAAFCPNKLLLQELATVLAARAGQLHAADTCRLLWAYSAAGVVDASMLAAVTSATAEEMHDVLPRTAAGAIWSLAQMRFEAPAFMEAALDRLAACLEATPLRLQHSASSSQSNRISSSNTLPELLTLQQTLPEPGIAPAIATAADGSSWDGDGSAATEHLQASGSVVREPSVLQQLLVSPSPALLSGGPAASHTPSGELSLLGMMHRRRRSNKPLQQAEQRALQQMEPDAQQQHTQHQVEDDVDGLLAQVHCNLDSQEDLQQPQTEPASLSQSLQPQQRCDAVHCSHRDVAQAVYACGRLQHYNGTFFRALRTKFLLLLPGFSDGELINVLWGLARLNLYEPVHMEAVAAELLQRSPRLSGPLTALSVWCCASLKHHDSQLLQALAQRAVLLAGRGQLAPLDACQLVRAAARLGHRDEAMFRAAAQVLQQHIPRMGDSMIVNSLWAFAVAGVFVGELFSAGFAKVGSLPPGKARPLLLLQLFQTVTLLQDAFSTAGVDPPAKLPAGLLAAATRQWMFSNRKSPGWRPSSFQTAVADVLSQQLGLDVQQEILTQDGLFSIDLAVEWQGRRVAVEVDGPKHFTNSRPYRLLGSSLAKQRCLQARGWAVLSVPFYIWDELAKTARLEQQQQQQQEAQHGQQQDKHGQEQQGRSAAEARQPDQRRQTVSRHGNGVDSRGGPSDAAVADARAQYLAMALDEAVALAYMPRGMPSSQQLTHGFHM